MTPQAEQSYSKAKTLIWAATAICVALYAFAYWCEAAYFAGGMDFTERISWQRLTEALPLVTWKHLRSLEWAGVLAPVQTLVLLGALLVSVLTMGIHNATWRSAALRVLSFYAVLFFAVGGWVSVLALLISLPQPIDGELFDEGIARLDAAGIWFLVVTGLAIAGWRRERRQLRRQAPTVRATAPS